MKFIDEKGRLFGKINIIDFLVILFLICFIPMFYLGYKILIKKPVQAVEQKESIWVEYPFNLIKIKSEIIKSIKLGNKEIDGDGKIIGEIIWIDESRPYTDKFKVGNQNVIYQYTSGLREIPVILKLKVEIKNGNLYYKDKQITYDSPIEFKTQKYIVEAKLTSIMVPKIKKLDLSIILKDLTEDTLKLITVGDKEIDGSGDVAAEILKIGKTENNNYEFNIGGGDVVVGEDSTNKQRFVKMRIKCEIKNDEKAYFHGKEIAYNSLLEFDMGKYTVNGVPASLLINEKWVEAKIKFLGIITEVANVIRDGDIEKDPSGRLVGRLKNIISNKSSEMQILALDEKKLVAINKPFQRDIVAVFNLLCIEKDGILYFKNYPVKMGNIITFTTDLYGLQGVIIGLEEF